MPQPTAQNQQPTIEHDHDDETDDDRDEAEAEAIADALLGRKTQTRLSIGNHIHSSSPSRLSCLEEGQVHEEDDGHQLQSRSIPENSSTGPHPPPSSLLDRLGPPSQSASLTSSSSPQDDRARKTHVQIPEEPKPLSRNSRAAHRQQQQAHSPKRPHHSRSRSPNRQPPLSATEQRRASLSSRITLSNRHHSCSPIALQFDVQSRCQQIARRFSSPSNSTPTTRKDAREQREGAPAPSAPRNESNNHQHRPHHHHSSSSQSHHQHNNNNNNNNNINNNNPGPSSNSKASNSNAIALPTNKSPTLKNPALRVSVLIENLPSFTVLTPRRLYDHLAHLVPPKHRQEATLPYGLKLYRYARSDCVCAELRFHALVAARNFAHKASRAWPSIWYTASKAPPDTRKKFMEFTVLEGDKPVTWPSRFETYYPKLKSDLYRPNTRAVEEEPSTVETETSPSAPQARQAPIPEFGRRRPASTNPSTAPVASKFPKPTNASASKAGSSDRPKGRPAEEEHVAPVKKKARPPALQAPSIEESHELIKNEISILLSQSSSSKPPKDTKLTPSNEPPKDSKPPMTKISTKDANPPPTNQPANGQLFKTCDDSPAGSVPVSTQSDEHQPPFTSVINVPIAPPASGLKIPGLNGRAGQQENPSPALTLQSGSSKSPESADTKFPNPLFTMESIPKDSKDQMNGVLLSKMLPSITLSVLQSHFLIPNRPRDFRIFEPIQISYGPFFSPHPVDQMISSSSSSSSSNNHNPFNHQLEIGCLISFSDPNTAAHFCRVLELNSPFHPLQVRVVDPAHIQFLPSASTISNPPKQQQGYMDPSGTFYGSTSGFYGNGGYLDVQNQYNWSTVPREMIQSGSPLGIGPTSQLAESRPSSLPIHPHQHAEMVYNNSPYGYLNDYNNHLLGHHMSPHPTPSPLSFGPSLSYNNHSPFSITNHPPAVSDPSQDLSSLLSSSSSTSQNFVNHQLPPIPPPQSQATNNLHPPSSRISQDFSHHPLPPLPLFTPQRSPPPPTLPPPTTTTTTTTTATAATTTTATASTSNSSHDIQLSNAQQPPSASTSVDSLEILTFLPNPSSFDHTNFNSNSNSNSVNSGSNSNSNPYFYSNSMANSQSISHSNFNPNPNPDSNSSSNLNTDSHSNSNSNPDLNPNDHANSNPITSTISATTLPSSTSGPASASDPSSTSDPNSQLQRLERLKKILQARKTGAH
ncbi:hypothetical protein PGT21_000719 [Puccinia graminis f. sp. tritici]|uniref:Uncharacterized protein n=1 Tax=Puccinia graminis f. sp. tritici TaxID=56615 RepID=A0A5B0NBA0_PUCGR|nr:hypothetical protein PGT21_000719 [Puccinia graminis f. sp. tritici]